MRKNFLITFAITCFIISGATAQISMPAPSPTAMIRQDFGMGRIELTYSRPSIRERSLLKENSVLAPLGKPWRTGANAATKLRFTDNVTIGGKSLDTGSYVIYTIPGKSEWAVVISKGTAYPGQQGFTENDDVVRVKVPATSTKDKVENFTMQFANVQNESCELQMMWGQTAIKLPVTTNVKDRLRTQIEAALKTDKKPYSVAATFYYEWDKDYTRALENINKAIEANATAYNLYLTKAKIQKDMGDKAGAKASLQKTVETATTGKNDDYVRQANDLLKNL